ncbi:MAG: calcium-binding protein [Hyphomicrobiaceae bacterium]
MAQIDATLLTTNFQAIDDTMVNPVGAVTSLSGFVATWATAAAAPFWGYTLSSSLGDISLATPAGTIDGITISRKQSAGSSYVPMISIADLSVSLTDLVDLVTPANTHEMFWETVLAGATTVLVPGSSGQLYMFGDFLTVNAGTSRTGAADSFIGTNLPNGSSTLVGDAYGVEAGATLRGGNDTFSGATGAQLIGDAEQSVGVVIGGADTFTITDNLFTPTTVAGSLYGDVMTSLGALTGGADVFTIHDTANVTGIFGDALTHSSAEDATGGNDTILVERHIVDGTAIPFSSVSQVTGDINLAAGGSTYRGGNDKITLRNTLSTVVDGDFNIVNGNIIGGNDTILIENTRSYSATVPGILATQISGDVGTNAVLSVGDNFTGGADTITVRSVTVGSSIVGDATAVQGVGGNLVKGGADTIAISTLSYPVSAPPAIIGDATYVLNAAFEGGTDRITVSIGPNVFAIGSYAGDVLTFSSNVGADNFTGGNDTITFSGINLSGSLQIYGDALTATGMAGATFKGGNDTLIGAGTNDFIYGDAVGIAGFGTIIGGNDTLDGRGGNDVLDGGLGTDTAVFGLAQAVHVNLGGIAGSNGNLADPNGDYEAIGQGFDHLIGIENVTGSSKNDVIIGDAQNNVLNGGSGNDRLDGGPGGIDTLIGGKGNDTHVLQSGDKASEAKSGGSDTIETGAFSVNLANYANFENVRLTGASARSATGTNGANVLNGETNSAGNVLKGLLGNDTYIIGAGDTVIDTGGTDKLKSGTISLNLASQAGGNAERAYLTGSANLNITGNAANNILSGNAGVNSISGSGGNDTINGGLGNDILNGGSGKDIFIFNTDIGAAPNIDTINSYSVADDTIKLENAIFASLVKTGTLSTSYFRVGAAAVDSNDYIVYDKTTGALYYDADGSGAIAAIQFATISNKASLTAADFVII